MILTHEISISYRSLQVTVIRSSLQNDLLTVILAQEALGYLGVHPGNPWRVSAFAPWMLVISLAGRK